LLRFRQETGKNFTNLEETEMREYQVSRTKLLKHLPLLASMCLALNLLQFAVPALAQQKKKPAAPPPPAATTEAPAQEQDAKKPNILFIIR
jgi:hypothetical protein